MVFSILSSCFVIIPQFRNASIPVSRSVYCLLSPLARRLVRRSHNEDGSPERHDLSSPTSLAEGAKTAVFFLRKLTAGRLIRARIPREEASFQTADRGCAKNGLCWR
jgi:hypothetical protein